MTGFFWQCSRNVRLGDGKIGCQASSLTRHAGCQPAPGLFGRLAASRANQPGGLISDFAADLQLLAFCPTNHATSDARA